MFEKEKKKDKKKKPGTKAIKKEYDGD